MKPAEKYEQTRYAVLAYYYSISACAQSAPTAARMLAREHDLTVDEVRATAEFLAEKGWLKRHYDDMGATVHYQISADGILYAERKGLDD